MNSKFSRAMTKKLRKPITKKVSVSKSTNKKNTKDPFDNKSNRKISKQPTVLTIGDNDFKFIKHNDKQPSRSLINWWFVSYLDKTI